MLDQVSTGKYLSEGNHMEQDKRLKTQQTLRNSIPCNGIGLHSGEKISLTLHPADAHTGIMFRRSDVKASEALIPAKYDLVTDTMLCTKLTNEFGVSVGTVEHLMSALSGYDIDNAIVEVSGAELPVMDGSSEHFAFLLDCAGIEDLGVARQAILVRKKIEAKHKDSVASIEPSDRLTMRVAIDFDHQTIGHQEMYMEVYSDRFRKEISRARTFGFLHEVEAMRKAGLGRGGSLENAVVVATDGVMNEDGLRFEDEFVRHKILDCIGDIALAGAPIIGHVYGYKTGHALNNKLMHALFADPSNYAYVDMTEFEASVLPMVSNG